MRTFFSFTVASHHKALDNLALGAIAVQSSQYNDLGSPLKDIDGNKATDYSFGSCTHTETWWKVDLGDVYSVSKVVITNRGDCCSERIEGAQMHIGSCFRNNGNKNLASRRNTVQSSMYNYNMGCAQNTVDGNIDPDFMEGSCPHTVTENNPWWRLDLTTVYNVAMVTITNREDCCSERIEGAQIHFGNSLENNGNDNEIR
ncbi:uncharacterized protein LOC127424972 [Myxocyprinus asiaticus]|uniref:uncharacterized protein LOC127424972 n=1 Tax=Myxocyprinus asiaticus TaxID=70543 RepID=UPI00222219DC|nr:uncharacterized protein LOC127424972 [Myxocyprinus asiaticus]